MAMGQDAAMVAMAEADTMIVEEIAIETVAILANENGLVTVETDVVVHAVGIEIADGLIGMSGMVGSVVVPRRPDAARLPPNDAILVHQAVLLDTHLVVIDVENKFIIFYSALLFAAYNGSFPCSSLIALLRKSDYGHYALLRTMLRLILPYE
ncbi:hypothetical protein RvY_03243-2 [Ramazzottius varieornatus]|uniref:Uncharacterized protein n=1 Tax=Ramazzottius varieornatus TaxID=947166 RepID=A0A1D1UMD6_RAMVA|nr:hypothetical protein RvY_03243-2 [Ramazzottius varieornatus]